MLGTRTSCTSKAKPCLLHAPKAAQGGSSSRENTLRTPPRLADPQARAQDPGRPEPAPGASVSQGPAARGSQRPRHCSAGAEVPVEALTRKFTLLFVSLDVFIMSVTHTWQHVKAQKVKARDLSAHLPMTGGHPASTASAHAREARRQRAQRPPPEEPKRNALRPPRPGPRPLNHGHSGLSRPAWGAAAEQVPPTMF